VQFDISAAAEEAGTLQLARQLVSLDGPPSGVTVEQLVSPLMAFCMVVHEAPPGVDARSTGDQYDEDGADGLPSQSVMCAPAPELVHPEARASAAMLLGLFRASGVLSGVVADESLVELLQSAAEPFGVLGSLLSSEASEQASDSVAVKGLAPMLPGISDRDGPGQHGGMRGAGKGGGSLFRRGIADTAESPRAAARRDQARISVAAALALQGYMRSLGVGEGTGLGPRDAACLLASSAGCLWAVASRPLAGHALFPGEQRGRQARPVSAASKRSGGSVSTGRKGRRSQAGSSLVAAGVRAA